MSRKTDERFRDSVFSGRSPALKRAYDLGFADGHIDSENCRQEYNLLEADRNRLLGVQGALVAILDSRFSGTVFFDPLGSISSEGISLRDTHLLLTNSLPVQISGTDITAREPVKQIYLNRVVK